MASARALLSQLVVLALLAALTAGAGLPGLVRALAGPSHVCTCATGGSHVRCPVCNPALGRRTRCAMARVEGVPCGERATAMGSGVEPALAPPALVALLSPRSAMPVMRAVRAAPEDVYREPVTPPPRRIRREAA